MNKTDTQTNTQTVATKHITTAHLWVILVTPMTSYVLWEVSCKTAFLFQRLSVIIQLYNSVLIYELSDDLGLELTSSHSSYLFYFSFWPLVHCVFRKNAYNPGARTQLVYASLTSASHTSPDTETGPRSVRSSNYCFCCPPHCLHQTLDSALSLSLTQRRHQSWAWGLSPSKCHLDPPS